MVNHTLLGRVLLESIANAALQGRERRKEVRGPEDICCGPLVSGGRDGYLQCATCGSRTGEVEYKEGGANRGVRLVGGGASELSDCYGRVERDADAKKMRAMCVMSEGWQAHPEARAGVPQEALEVAAHTFSLIDVTARKAPSVMAACLADACARSGYIPQAKQIAALTNSSARCRAAGEKKLRDIKSTHIEDVEGDIAAKVNSLIASCMDRIASAGIDIENVIPSATNEHIRDYVKKLVMLLIYWMVSNCERSTKVTGALYYTLCKFHGGMVMTPTEYSNIVGCSTNSVTTFMKMMKENEKLIQVS